MRLRHLRPFTRFQYDPVYRANYLVVCCPRDAFHAEVRRYLTKHTTLRPDVDEILGLLTATLVGSNGRCFRLDHKTTDLLVIWLRPGADYGTVVHEAWHAAYWVLHRRGVWFDNGDGADEPMAYYLQWLVRWMTNLPTAAS